MLGQSLPASPDDFSPAWLLACCQRCNRTVVPLAHGIYLKKELKTTTAPITDNSSTLCTGMV